MIKSETKNINNINNDSDNNINNYINNLNDNICENNNLDNLLGNPKNKNKFNVYNFLKWNKNDEYFDKYDDIKNLYCGISSLFQK